MTGATKRVPLRGAVCEDPKARLDAELWNRNLLWWVCKRSCERVGSAFAAAVALVNELGRKAAGRGSSFWRAGSILAPE
jgi:hypothetical protein